MLLCAKAFGDRHIQALCAFDSFRPVTSDNIVELQHLNGFDRRKMNGIVTLSEFGPIWTTDRQAKPLKSHASKSAVVGKFQSIRLNVTTPTLGIRKGP